MSGHKLNELFREYVQTHRPDLADKYKILTCQAKKCSKGGLKYRWNLHILGKKRLTHGKPFMLVGVQKFPERRPLDFGIPDIWILPPAEAFLRKTVSIVVGLSHRGNNLDKYTAFLEGLNIPIQGVDGTLDSSNLPQSLLDLHRPV